MLLLFEPLPGFEPLCITNNAANPDAISLNMTSVTDNLHARLHCM